MPVIFNPNTGAWTAVDDQAALNMAEDDIARAEAAQRREQDWGPLSPRDAERTRLHMQSAADLLRQIDGVKLYSEPIQPFISNYGRERHAPPTTSPHVEARFEPDELTPEEEALIAAATRHRLERAAQELADEDTVHDAHSPAEAVHDAPSPEEHKAAVSFRHDPSGVFVVTGRGPMLTHTSREAAAAEFDRRCKAARA